MQTVLITGVAGLIGSRMADWILENKPLIQVIGIDNLSGGFRENVNSGVRFYQLDCQSEELQEVFRKHRPKIVYHFAAYAAEGLSPFIRKYNYDNNLLATANIINMCIKNDVGRLVFTSSMAVYGNGNPPFHENDVPRPIDPYGIAKYACEMDIRVAGEQHGLDWCIIRPHNVYGVKQNIWDTFRNVLGIWMSQYLSGCTMTIFGDGEQRRAFSFVDDCLESLWIAGNGSRASKEIINLGSGVFYTINEVNKLLRSVMGGGVSAFTESRHEVKDAYPTCQKSVDILAYKENTPIVEGMEIMWEWARVQRPRKSLSKPTYELEKGIYSFWSRLGKETVN